MVMVWMIHISLHFLLNEKKKGKKEKERELWSVHTVTSSNVESFSKFFFRVLFSHGSFHMSCHTLEFQPQTKNLELRFTWHRNKLLTAKL